MPAPASLHSEFNPSGDAPVHFLQIWLMPDRSGHTPRYAQRAFDRAAKLNRLALVVSPDGADGSVEIHQDARALRLDLWKPARRPS